MTIYHMSSYQKKLAFVSACGEYTRFLTAQDLMDLLKVSRATAYRMRRDGKFNSAQREILEFKLFGLIPGWNGWRIEPGNLIDPAGYKYSMGEIQSIPLLKSMSRCR